MLYIDGFSFVDLQYNGGPPNLDGIVEVVKTEEAKNIGFKVEYCTVQYSESTSYFVRMFARGKLVYFGWAQKDAFDKILNESLI